MVNHPNRSKKNKIEENIFTPLAKDGETRLKFYVKNYDGFLRGDHNAYKQFTLETVDNRKITCEVIPCSLDGCFCDAQVIKII